MRDKINNAAKVLVTLSGFVPNLVYIPQAVAQMTSNTVLNMSASVVNPLAVTPSVSVNLSFGIFGIKGTGAYVVKATSAAITNGFTISGNQVGTGMIGAPQNASVTLSIPTYKVGSNIVLDHSSGGGTANKEIIVKSIYVATKSGLSNAAGTMRIGKYDINSIKVTNPADTGRFFMGARLLFGVNQLLGAYSGQFTLRITL